MTTAIVLDSASDFHIKDFIGDLSEIEVAVVPLNIQFGTDHYLDDVTITKEEFYQRMEKEPELPKTSQPSPQAFYETFERLVKEGKEVIYLALAGNLSGTVQSAAIGKDMLSTEDQKKVFILDSGIASAGILVLLTKALNYLREGLTALDVLMKLNEVKHTIKGYVLLETIENVRKGGRMSAVQGAIAEFLNIKPLVSVQNGIVETVGKFRGKKKGVLKLKEMIHEWRDNNPGKNLFVIHSYPSKEEVKKEFSELFSFSSFPNVSFTKFGSTIGTHASKNAIGFISY